MTNRKKRKQSFFERVSTLVVLSILVGLAAGGAVGVISLHKSSTDTTAGSPGQ